MSALMYFIHSAFLFNKKLINEKMKNLKANFEKERQLSPFHSD
jgi:hypothetical protein